MKRFLLFALGMVLLGTAGLLIVHQVVESPSTAVAQSGGPPHVGSRGGPIPGGGGDAAPPGEPGQYKDIVPALLEALADADGGVRQLAAATLVKIGPDAVPPLIEAMKAKDRETRANAAYVLGHQIVPAREAMPALAKALKDEDKDVRRRAAYALHSIVVRSEVTPGGALGEGIPGAAGLAGSAAGVSLKGLPMPGAAMPQIAAPLDPGLLLPEVSPAPKPAKEEKKD
jgi:hypothetical protein